MSENENRNDPIEEFFQRKTGEYDISYKDEDWTQLERKLDLRDAQISYRRRVRWIAAASLLIVSMLGYFTFENYNRINDLSEQLSDNISNEAGTQADPGEPVPDSTTLESDVDMVVDTGNPSTEFANNQDSTPLASVPEASQTDSPITFSGENQRPVGRAELNRENVLIVRDIGRNRFIPESAFVSVADEITSPVINPVQIRNSDPRGTTASQRIPGSGIDNLDPGRVPVWSRFTLGFVSAPDLSTVGSVSNFYDPGYKLGIMAEYDLGPNMSISAGFVQSKVRYTAGNGEYNAPIYWEAGMSPSEIIGECLLIDIPINFKYNFLNFGNSRFFATAGLSSYIMLNEDYYFSYDNEGSGGIREWSGKTGTRHWMSNAGFSIGYELDIHRNWSLRAEPFIKVPLDEVGWGNVRLYSTGSFLSVYHRL